MSQASATPVDTRSPSGGVQSVQRALDLVEIVAAGGGQMAIGEIAAGCDIPLPTIHRLLKTLIERGYMRQLPNRRYALGYRLVPLGAAAGTMVGAKSRPTDQLSLLDGFGSAAAPLNSVPMLELSTQVAMAAVQLPPPARVVSTPCPGAAIAMASPA